MRIRDSGIGRRLAGALQAGLLAFLHAGVARQVVPGAQRRAQILDVYKRQLMDAGGHYAELYDTYFRLSLIHI